MEETNPSEKTSEAKDNPATLSNEDNAAFIEVQRKWAKKVLSENKDFIVNARFSPYTSIVFTLGPEASKSLAANRETWTPIYKKEFDDLVISELGSRFKVYSVKIEFEASIPPKVAIEKSSEQNPTNSKSVESSIEWEMCAGQLWSGVKLYFGQGSEKKYIGEVLGGGKDSEGNKMVLIEKNGTRTWKSRNHIISSYYYIKSNDPAKKNPVWYDYDY